MNPTLPNKYVAAVLEMLPGVFHVFGMGHVYAGSLGWGQVIFFAYLFLQAFNLLLCFLLVGFFTFPVTWLLFLGLSPWFAKQRAARRAAVLVARVREQQRRLSRNGVGR